MVSYLFRECLVMSGLQLQLLSCGISITFPSILADAFQQNHTDIHPTPDQLDMIMGSFGLYGLFLLMAFPIMMQQFGRKATNIALSVCTITGSVIVAMARSVTLLIAGRFIQGLAYGGYYISSLIAAEYVHPKRRGIHIIVKGLFNCLGELLCHGLGLTIFTYKQVAWMNAIPPAIAILVTLQWPESPSYLAYRGRYEECAKSFEWLRGTNHEAKNELQKLILSQKQNKENNTSSKLIQRVLKTFRRKDFLKPLAINTLLVLIFETTGAMTILAYITQIVNKISGDQTKALYYTLGLDLMQISSCFVSGSIIRYVRRRVILFSASSVSCSLLALLICFYYLDKIEVLSIKWLSPLFFVLYYIVIYLFVVPVSLVAQGEIMPLRYKGIGGCVVGFEMGLFSAIFFQYSWKMLSVLDIHGTFSVFLVCQIVILVITYFVLPETKGRTLQDIENDFVDAGKKYEEADFKVTEKLVTK